MKITRIDADGRSGEAVFSGNALYINLSLVDAKPGDYVLVHAGCAIEIVKQDEAEEILNIFETLGGLSNGP